MATIISLLWCELSQTGPPCMFDVTERHGSNIDLKWQTERAEVESEDE